MIRSCQRSNLSLTSIVRNCLHNQGNLYHAMKVHRQKGNLAATYEIISMLWDIRCATSSLSTYAPTTISRQHVSQYVCFTVHFPTTRHSVRMLYRPFPDNTSLSTHFTVRFPTIRLSVRMFSTDRFSTTRLPLSKYVSPFSLWQYFC
jgi:hypothetical protein